MSFLTRLAVLATLVSLPVGALSWRALNWHEVFELGDGVYEVVGRPGTGAADYWCGIGDYAITQLRVKVVQRIYTWKGVGPSVARPGRHAMQFAFAPPEGADTSTSYSLSMKRVGDNLTAAAAQQYCYGSKFTEPWRNF